MTSYYVTGGVTPVLDCHKKSWYWIYLPIESISRSCVPLNNDQEPREVKVHSLRFWRCNGAVGPKSWHHITSREVSHRYWIVTIGHKIEKRGPQRPYPGPIIFGWPKTELGKPRYEKLIWGPVNGPLWRKNGFFGVDFEDLLLDIFEKFIFSQFSITNVHLIPGFRGRRSSLKNWRILGWTPYCQYITKPIYSYC